MGLIDNLNKAASVVKGDHATDAISLVREAFDVWEEDTSYGGDLANVLSRIAERIEKECVPVPLDMDGKPIEIDGAYYGLDGEKFLVVGLKGGSRVVCSKDGGHFFSRLSTHLSKTPPDTQERIDHDVSLSSWEYLTDVMGIDPAELHRMPGTKGERKAERRKRKWEDLMRRKAALDARA